MALVTLYSAPGYTGANVALDEGGFRFHGATDFNDAAVSVRVAAGHCALLYEHANEFGGYGATIALVEDCPDLGKHGFSLRTSFVQVFKRTREGFMFVPGGTFDGRRVEGRWQRIPAGIQLPARGQAPVVSPPIPAPTRSIVPPGSVDVRDHRGEEGGPVSAPDSGTGDAVIRDHRTSQLKHIFVLVLENRSFDHMLGFSDISGTDARTGQPTKIIGLTGNETNDHDGVAYRVVRGAPDVAAHDPGHGFGAVLEQLCGQGASYPSGGAYPPIGNSGFASNYGRSHPEDPQGAMRCFTPDQVPVITQLAREFVVCDRWFCSMPGPTEPNRWFIHAATAGDHDGSPSDLEIFESQANPFGGVEFENGSIFQLLDRHGVKWRIYACDSFPNVSELDGVSRTWDVDDYEDFLEDIQSPDYDAGYTFIEPSYDVFDSFRGGNSQHPLGSARAGEMLIKRTYEALRKSPAWESSMLIVTYDEHGGYYDHVAPPPAVATGSTGRDYGFTFEQCGPRVPAIVVSPLVPRNLVDHGRYEHSSVIATLTGLFKLGPLTARSRASSGLAHLASLEAPRTDAPMTLADPFHGAAPRMAAFDIANVKAARPDAPLADDPNGNIAGAVRGGLNQHLQLAPPAQHAAIRARVQSLRTQGQALAYLKEVDQLVRRARAKAGITRSPRVRRAPSRQAFPEPAVE